MLKLFGVLLAASYCQTQSSGNEGLILLVTSDNQLLPSTTDMLQSEQLGQKPTQTQPLVTSKAVLALESSWATPSLLYPADSIMMQGSPLSCQPYR